MDILILAALLIGMTIAWWKFYGAMRRRTDKFLSSIGMNIKDE